MVHHQAFGALHAEWAPETERLLAPETSSYHQMRSPRRLFPGQPNKLMPMIKMCITIGNLCAIF